jgi:hypothetical protein
MVTTTQLRTLGGELRDTVETVERTVALGLLSALESNDAPRSSLIVAPWLATAAHSDGQHLAYLAILPFLLNGRGRPRPRARSLFRLNGSVPISPKWFRVVSRGWPSRAAMRPTKW